MLNPRASKACAIALCSWLMLSACDPGSATRARKAAAAAAAERQKEVTAALTAAGGVHTFNQKIDSTNPSSVAFAQRYAIDSQYAQSKASPVILYVCGEAKCFDDKAEYPSFVGDQAKQHHAFVIELEHRFFGSSKPVNQLTTENLVTLNLNQALSDLASFQVSISRSLGLTGKWVAMGQGYGGSLAAFYRMRNFNLVAGAIGVSAPVVAQADYEDFDKYVAQSLPQQCLAAISDVNHQVESALGNPSEIAKLKGDFGLASLTEDKDLLYYLAQIPAKMVHKGSAAADCASLTGGDHLKGMIALGAKYFGKTPIDATPQAAELPDPTTQLSDAGWAERARFYLACTQYGHFRVSNPSSSAQSSQLDLSYYTDLCDRLFQRASLPDFDSINRDFSDHLQDKTSTHILLTSGKADPTASLSVNSSPNDPTKISSLLQSWLGQ